MDTNKNTDNAEKNNSGLNPVKIGNLPRAKGRKTSLIMFLFLAILISAVYFLPDIDKFVRGEKADPYKDDSSSKVIIPNNNNDFFPISISSKINVDNHTFTNFRLNEEFRILDYSVTNYNSQRSSIDNKNWYLGVFDSDKNLLEYLRLEGPILSSKVSFDLSLDLKDVYDKSPQFIKIGIVEEKDYPNVSLATDDFGNKYLTCLKDSSELIYYFNNNKLFKIVDSFSTNRTIEGPNYDFVYESYKARSSNLSASENFTSTFKETSTSFEFEATLDLAEANYSNFDKNYLKGDTNSKEVNFIMEARGFDCK